MKPQLTLVALFLFFGSLTAQVKFKVKLLNDNLTYQVLLRPVTSWSNPLSTTTAGQVTMRVPVGGFAPGTITNIKGVWKLINTVTAPVEAPGFVYYIYGLDTQIPGNQITYTAGVEIPVFSYQNTGACTGPVEIIDNNTDPFLEPNSQNLGIKNYLTVLGAGQGVNAYIGNYTSFDADCSPISNCGIEVFDVQLIPPSACGVADGQIIIDATNSTPFPLRYTITYNNVPVVYQASNTFTGLASGNTFYVAVKNSIGTCIVDVGAFELPGPLAAIPQGADLNNPDCGSSNGSIVIHATSPNGGTLEYAMSSIGPWQSSNTFGNLAEGTYTFYVRDIVNNCQDLFGTYTLTGCVEPHCILTYDINNLGNGRYEVDLLTDTLWNPPLNTTSNLQVTLKVPTGGFVAGNVVDQTPNVDFDISEVITAPIEDPTHDYITISLQSPTQGIPYNLGGTVHLFTFENTGTCTGDSIRFMLDDDPFVQPNSQNSTAGQYISVLGYGSAGAPICLAKKAVICDAVPPPPPSCLLTYEVEKLAGDIFQVSIISDTTWNFPLNQTSSAQVVLKVPTGGFQVGNLTDLAGDWEVDVVNTAPVEDPTSDYISIQLATPSALDVFQTGVKTPIFSFKNVGTCQGGQVTLMPNDDPFLPPNSANSNVNQYISPFGAQGQSIEICLSNLPADDCTNDPCADLQPKFGPLSACEGTQFTFQDSTITTETITSWSWDFGDNSAVSTSQSPSHTYSSSGNFEVSLTVTTQSGCNKTFMDFVTVFPSPGDAPVSSFDICNGASVTLQTPANITSAVWTPTTGLDLTDPFNPIANPANTTIYALTATNSFGCVNTSQVTVNVLTKPVISNVTVTPISDCNKTDASIQVTASGAGSVEYGIDNGNGITWQSSGTFSNLAADTFLIYVRNGNGSCEVAYNSNPVIITAPTAPSITNVAFTQPNGCANDGTITITATGGQGPLRYSIGGSFQASNTFTGLGGGTFNIAVTNNNGSCGVTAVPVVLTQATPPTIQPIANQNICVGSSANISVQSSAAFTSYTIGGTGVHSGEAIVGNKLNFVASANAVGTTTYNVTLTQANGCTATTSFSLTGVAVPDASFTVSPVICTNGEVILHNSWTNPNAALVWGLAGAQVISASTQNSTSPDSATMVVKWTSQGTKTINLTVDNGGCTTTTTQTITVAAFDPGASFDKTPPTCGLSNGSITLNTNSPTYTLAWSNGKTTPTIGNLAAGSYSVTITDSQSQCMATASTTLTGSPAVAIIGTSVVPPTQCAGGNGDGSVTAIISGGTAPYTYNLGSNIPPTISSQTTVTFNNIAAGTYSLTVTDAVGCTAVKTIVVNSVSSQVTVSVTSVDAGCTTDNGSISATVGGGSGSYNYSLYKNNVAVTTGQPVTGSTVSLNGLAPATYLFVFEDTNTGCIGAGAKTVNRMAGSFPAAAVITPSSCGSNNGAIQLNGVPSGATTVWSTGVTGNPQNGLPAGVYGVTITENNGCVSDSIFVVNTTGGQTVSLGAIVGATCGLANGSVTFTVTGGNQYSWKLLGSQPQLGGFGTPDNPTTISDVPKGAYVLEITDVLQSNCKVYQVVSVPGSDAFQTQTTVQFSTGCGNHNGSISLEITGGQMPYSVVSNAGTIVPGANPNQFTVTGLYEGVVEVTITGAGGCQKILTQDMGQFDEPNIENVLVTNPTCPDGMGSITTTSINVYQIFNLGNTQVGQTPWIEATGGTYILQLTIDGCTATDTVTVTEPDAWAVNAQIVDADCNTEGTIALTIGGATGPYDIEWSNTQTTATISNLQPGIYTATITDSQNCQFIEGYTVADTCTVAPCSLEDVFYIDLYSIEIKAPETEICLPTNESNIDDYKLTLDNQPYDRPLGDCADETNFYDGFDVLPAPDPLGYMLVRWEFGGKIEENHPFANLQALVAAMRAIDAGGNWVLDGNTIFGGNPTKVYGNMVVKHISSGFSLNLSPSKLSIPHPSISVSNSTQVHVLIAESPTGCLDTLYINLLKPAPPTSDTIFVEVAVGDAQTVCIPVDELIGNLEFLSNIAISFTNNAQVLSGTDNCIEVVGVDEGPDMAIIVICDDLGVCDTTFVIITVTQGSNEIVIYNGFSPNGDGVNDFFKIRNIELYPKNDIKIYNRWGKQVFSTKEYKNNWDADYQDQRLPDGSYFYFLNVEVDGKKKMYKGFVEVRR